MAKKTSTGKVVIKSLGKRSGKTTASALTQVVREARGKFVVKKKSALKIKDTATGSGHIGFHKAEPEPRKTKLQNAA